MKLYHTSSIIIKEPEYDHGRKNADFGQGFYLSPDLDFSYRWAKENSYINIYELDIEDLDIYTFKKDEEWFEYIYNNRHFKDNLNVDVIIGPIASDTIYDTLGLFASGILSKEESLRLFLLGNEYTQVALKTKKAISKLRWLDVLKIEDASSYQALRKKEEEGYQRLIAENIEDE